MNHPSHAASLLRTSTLAVRSRRSSTAANPAWRGVWARLLYLALLFSTELVAVPLLVGQTGLVLQAGFWGPPLLRGAVVFAVVFAAFSWLGYQPVFARISKDLSQSPIGLPALAAHFGSMVLFTFLSSRLLHDRSGPVWAIWLATGLCAIVLAAISFIETVYWRRMVKQTGWLWLWSAAAAVLVLLAKIASSFLWDWTSGVTFRISQALLSQFIPGLIVDQAHMILGNSSFSVLITPQCSGLEGVMLIAVFGIAWLGIFWRECRFPQALFLLPAGIAIVFVLNSVRIAALVLIGVAGAQRIASTGFHSQAGWIVFNLVALAFIAAARKLPWFTIQSAAGTPDSQSRPVTRPHAAFENPTLQWIAPLVAILAAGMLAAAFSADFEWLYPLRFFASAIALACFWRQYKKLDWHCGWLAPASGALVFLIWIGFDPSRSTAANATPAALAAASPLLRTLWIAVRVLAATVTVPIAEELAFRGFLYRRILSVDFDAISMRRFSWVALLGSSAIFGILHGDRWLVGTVAGLLYGLVFVRRGRIGDAVAAHATTNALLAIDVLVFHHWHLW